MSGRAWVQEDLVRVRELYPVLSTEKLAATLGRSVSNVYKVAFKLGVHKSEKFFESDESGRLRKGQTRPECIATQFQKGHAPANKGLRRPGWHAGRMKETQFKKGERSGIAASNWKPVGTVLPDPDGYLRIKVREAKHGVEPSGFGNTQVWPFLSRNVWQQHHGSVPAGHVIVFKDRDRNNCTIENLECISRGELANRNGMWNRYPRELAEAIQLNGALKRKLRKANGEKQDVGPSKSPVRNTGSAEGPGEAAGPGPGEGDQRCRADDHQHGQGGDRLHEGGGGERRQRVLRSEAGKPTRGSGRRPEASGRDEEDLLTVVCEGLLAYRAFVCARIDEIRETLGRSLSEVA